MVMFDDSLFFISPSKLCINYSNFMLFNFFHAMKEFICLYTIKSLDLNGIRRRVILRWFLISKIQKTSYFQRPTNNCQKISTIKHKTPQKFMNSGWQKRHKRAKISIKLSQKNCENDGHKVYLIYNFSLLTILFSSDCIHLKSRETDSLNAILISNFYFLKKIYDDLKHKNWNKNCVI